MLSIVVAGTGEKSETTAKSIDEQEVTNYAKQRYQSVLNKTIKNLKVPFAQAGTEIRLLEELSMLWTNELDQALTKGFMKVEPKWEPPSPDMDDIPQCDGNADEDSDYVPSNIDEDSNDSDDLQTVTSSKYLPYYTRSNSVKKENLSSGSPGRAEAKELVLADQIDVDVDGFGNYLGLEKPINAEDDQTDGEEDVTWSTNARIYCVIKKLARQQHIWKMELHDGIFNIKGIDYFFKKAYLEAKW